MVEVWLEGGRVVGWLARRKLYLNDVQYITRGETRLFCCWQFPGQLKGSSAQSKESALEEIAITIEPQTMDRGSFSGQEMTWKQLLRRHTRSQLDMKSWEKMHTAEQLEEKKLKSIQNHNTALKSPHPRPSGASIN